MDTSSKFMKYKYIFHKFITFDKRLLKKTKGLALI